MSLTVGSMFAGIGGIDLGLTRAGMTIKWQVENDEFCTATLRRNFIDAQRWRHAESFAIGSRAARRLAVDVLCAGFPCQPVSNAGKKKGHHDERWLWPETCRAIGILRPRWVLLENVSGLLRRGMSEVLSGLAGIGYDAEWDSIPAATFGSPHLRERIFLVSYASSARPQGEITAGKIWGRGLLAQRDWWLPEPDVARVADGSPGRVDSVRALGNAVVPAVAEWIGRRIIEIDTQERSAAVDAAAVY